MIHLMKASGEYRLLYQVKCPHYNLNCSKYIENINFSLSIKMEWNERINKMNLIISTFF